MVQSTTMIPKCKRDLVLHYLAKQHLKIIRHAPGAGGRPNMRHEYFVYQYYKNFQMIKRLKDKALALLQTQYAKKPRNPE